MFTRSGRGKQSAQQGIRGVVHAARTGAGREAWVREALWELRQEPGVERCGAWLEPSAGENSKEPGAVVFRGEVWESGEAFAAERWARLWLERPLPLGLLSVGKVAEFTMPESSNAPIVGPAMGMGHGLWVPVMAAGALRGVLLVAAHDAQGPLPRAVAGEVAEELALALEWEEQNRLAAERKADLELVVRVHNQLAAEFETATILREIVETCTLQESPQGVGAVFELIGERRMGLAVAAPSGARGSERLQICALSGEAAWGHSVEHGPLEMFWRQAVETCQVTAAGICKAWSAALCWRALAESAEGETQEELQMSWPMAQNIERCTREIVGEHGRRLGRVEVYREMTARRMFQSRMAQTEKLASLGQRVSGVVHDLSNPLTTILGTRSGYCREWGMREACCTANCEAFWRRPSAPRESFVSCCGFRVKRAGCASRWR